MNNCLTYAAKKYWREGGYLLMRKSFFHRQIQAGKRSIAHLVPHFLHMTTDGKITQYRPSRELWLLAKDWHPFRQWLLLWHFDGEIAVGDEWPDYLP